jgi:hypothetical protein
MRSKAEIWNGLPVVKTPEDGVIALCAAIKMQAEEDQERINQGRRPRAISRKESITGLLNSNPVQDFRNSLVYEYGEELVY